MRGIFLMSAAAVVLLLAPGCDNLTGERNPYPREQAQAGAQPRAAAAPRANLYPLTSPPPGAAQPMQGNMPTRIAAAPEYDAPPAAYDDPAYARAGYGTGMNTGINATPGYAVPVPPRYTSPAPTPVSMPASLSAAQSATAPTTAPGSAPLSAPAYTQPYAQQYAPTYSQQYIPSPAAMSMAAGYGYDGRGGLGPYDTSIYGTPGVISADAPTTQRHYGRVEGTADIVVSPGALGIPVAPSMPMTSSAPIVSSAPSPAPGYAGGAYPMASDNSINMNPLNSPAPAVGGAPAAYAPGAVQLVPAPDVPPGIHPNDAGPSQWFEVVRPGNGPLRIGRVSATCVCVGVRVPKRQIAAGERALVEARILTRPKVNNLTYGIYVNLVEPQQTVVDADVTVSL